MIKVSKVPYFHKKASTSMNTDFKMTME
uniref:Uncharacterized protein n=1 Tax=Rhizophora mucronata TaxID=61149 RepID=A0A2P2R1K0_RHIMU